MSGSLLPHCYKIFYASQVILFTRRLLEKITPKDPIKYPMYLVGAFTDGIDDNNFIVIGATNYLSAAVDLCDTANKSNWTFDIMKLNGVSYGRHTKNYSVRKRCTYTAKSIYDSDCRRHIKNIDNILLNVCSTPEMTRKGALLMGNYRL